MSTTLPPDLTLRIAPSLGAIRAEDWDACANPVVRPEVPVSASDDIGTAQFDESRCELDTENPFISHAFLKILEDSGCAVRRTGWAGAHVLVEDSAGTLLACAPTYVKSHSQGEYVFDHGWAEAYARAGGSYYPKIQVSVPFTPATGRRLLVRPGPRAGEATDALVAGLRALRARTEASSIHLTFLPREQWDGLGERGFLLRKDQQFHWFNEGYSTFEDFLSALASRKRKAIRRERREAVADGIVIEKLTGGDIREEHWDAFYAFYMDTGSRKWGRPYLNRTFFSLVGERMPEKVLLVMARRAGRYIAGAINFIGASTLYGRNWGCIEDHPFLHFEVCYHQAIEFAIQRKLARVEAGAQGEHKLARGYRPVTTYSAHDLADPALRRAVADYLRREAAYVDAAQEELREHVPFRKDAPD
ncbi:GNAT family N-acetyltransferase [Alsobacter sp. SYSU M60028]|uniref:GNAT family N-acetyltransferase n=1 Tax=Alsobacter ponti TaxID=2962936 RepID=A0ABT1LEF9_9HYPH|nr:GNAT family N-acetyltransferase [Alsobacter ponti]MCP8939877.1 GNAT family N-acetyltransferase [Alsobacter ponti]